MAEKSKTREITITDDSGTFNTFWRRITSNKEYDFGGLALFRKIISNEKAKLMHVIKTKKPKSVYELAKMLERDFKSVREDVKLLEEFGFINMLAEKTGKRDRHRPILVVDSMHVHIKL